MVSTTSHVTAVVMPFRTPARSATRNQPWSSIQPRMSGDFQPKRSPPDRNGTVNAPMLPELPGDVVIAPPCVSTNNSPAMNRAAPGAIRLIATPATMWFTPNVVVAKIVPRTIMPSRPMLIVPLRSATRPDKPARPIGAAVRSATPNVPLEVRSSVSDRIRVVERMANAPSTAASGNQRDERQLDAVVLGAIDGADESATTVMPVLPRSDSRA